jgi:hypothetical protein
MWSPEQIPWRCSMKVIAHDVRVTQAVPGVHRVELDGATVGYVQK